MLRSDAGGRTTGYIPDGQICGGGHRRSTPRTTPPAPTGRTTHLTAGSTIQLRYSNWAAHPGTFHLYITRNGWSPTTPAGVG